MDPIFEFSESEPAETLTEKNPFNAILYSLYTTHFIFFGVSGGSTRYLAQRMQDRISLKIDLNCGLKNL